MDIAILQFFARLRCPALNWVFGFFSVFGEAAVIAVLIVLLYWTLGKAGEQLLFTALSSAAFNGLLKAAVLRPRPYVAGVVDRVEIDLPFLSTVDLTPNVSFPSGHAQATAAGVFSGASVVKKWWVWLLAVLFTLLVCCSRLYFGVHYPTDVLAGAVFGFVFAVFWAFVFRFAYGARYFLLMGMAVAVLIAVPFFPVKDFIQTAGLLSGGAFALPLVRFLKVSPPKRLLKRLLRIPVGLIAAGVVFLPTYFFPEGAGFYLLQWFLVTFAALFLAQLLFKILKI